jgi:sialate O-acetylesterase
MSKLHRTGVAFLIGLLLAPTLFAAEAFRLHGLFTDNMVLQCEKPTAVFGWAPAGTQVSVKIAGQSVTATTDGEGRFRAMLAPLPPGGSHTLEVTCQGQTLTCRNVTAGEVWVASGQSNMEWPLSRAENASKVVPKAEHPSIRFLRVPEKQAADPATNIPDAGNVTWMPLTPDNAGDVSGVGYFFAARLQRELDRPVGIIQAAKGATWMCEWMGEQAFTMELPSEQVKPIADNWSKQRSQYVELLPKVDAFDAAMATLIRERIEAAKAAGQKPPRDFEKSVRQEVEAKLGKRPDLGKRPPRLRYNGIIAPLTGYTVRGVIWYQGEWDAWSGYRSDYAWHFQRMIRAWRQAFNDEVPFLFVQLHSNAAFGGVSYPLIRQAQLATLELPNTGMAVTLDTALGLHPGNKMDAGERLAQWGLGMVYGRNVVISGPLFKGAQPQGKVMKITFDHVAGGLKIGGEAAALRGFEVAGADGQWQPAEARIEGQTVTVSSEAVESPALVRYLWLPVVEGGSQGLLHNSAGLPASPFTTEQVLKAPAPPKAK